MWEQLRQLIKPRGAIVLFGSQPFTSALVMSNPGWFKYQWVWDKGRGFSPQLANIQPMRCHEDICVFSDGASVYWPQKTPLRIPDRRNPTSGSPNRKNGNGHQILSGSNLIVGERLFTDRFPETILYFPAVAQTLRQHDSEKPLALLEYLVKTYTNEGDRVLDFTTGSATALRACKNLKRHSVGIELLKEYCAVAVRRLQPVFEAALVDPGGSLEELPLFAQSGNEAA
jgi:site-specific DNA-methyltransferase (adenine-specific)